MIVSDTGMWSEDTPTVCTGMRGLADCEIELHGPDQDIHSGSFGGAVPNPATAAARLVAALHDDRARVAVPGFYDGITPSPTANGNSSPNSPSTKPNGCAPPSRTPPTERPVTPPSNGSGPAPPPRSTASEAATKAPAAKPSSPPQPR